MAYVERIVEAPRERVYQVLADGWSYSDWVVGTSHIRAVDESWPAPGARIYHKAGPWPLALQDWTISLASDPPNTLVVSPHLWPLGVATVHITLTEIAPGRTKVRIAEDFDRGPLRWARTKISDLVLHRRNREALRRLADVATRRVSPKQPSTNG
jgi:hypothetical protein